MSYILPGYIDSTLNQYPIDYSWDDSNVESKIDFSYAENITHHFTPITLRAKLLLLSGINDWILVRLSAIPFEPIFYQIAEAAYCANINKYLFNLKFQLFRNDYQGPVNGVLWCSGYSSVLANYFMSALSDDLDDNELYEEYHPTVIDDDLTFLIALTFHILPKEKKAAFDDWLTQVIKRLSHYYIPKQDGEFDHLFGFENDKDWLGDYVAREVLDLDYPYHPKDAVKLCDQFLQQVDYRNNPLLVPPQQLTGKIKHPYRLLE